MKEIFKLTYANRITKLLDNLGLTFNNISLFFVRFKQIGSYNRIFMIDSLN